MDEYERKNITELLRICADLMRYDAEERRKRRERVVPIYPTIPPNRPNDDKKEH